MQRDGRGEKFKEKTGERGGGEREGRVRAWSGKFADGPSCFCNVAGFHLITIIFTLTLFYVQQYTHQSTKFQTLDLKNKMRICVPPAKPVTLEDKKIQVRTRKSHFIIRWMSCFQTAVKEMRNIFIQSY